jgi:hypothetical protein
MTTFQDPPLQSRRSVRQNERDQSPAAVVPTTGPTPTPVAPAGPAEPLTYATQGLPPVADYDGPSFRARRTPDPVGDVPAAGAQPPADGTFRPRDYSPEGRRSASPTWAPQYGGAAAPAAPAADASSTPAAQAPAVVPSTLDAEEGIEHTLTRRELRALRDAHGITAATSTDETVYPTPAPAAEPPVAAAPVAPVAPVQDAAPVAQGTPLAAPSSRLDSALAEFDQLAGGRQPAAPTDPPAARGRRAAPAKAETPAPAPVETPVAAAPVAPVAPAGPAQIAPELLNPTPTPTPTPLVEPAAPSPAPEGVAIATDGVAVFDALFAAPPTPEPTPVVEQPAVVQPHPPVAPQPEVVVAEIVPQTPAAAYEQVIEATIVEPEIVAAGTPPAPVTEPPTSTPPTGHWSTQAQLDDETQFGDAQLARNIGSTSGAVTTSALVLPSIPNHDFGPIGTGDIMVTGSISLPQSLSATGALPAQLDESDLDHLLDPGDHQVASTDSQPVRAIKAVSTHTSSRGVIATVKPKGTRGLTALIIAATSMAVIVGALFIVLVVTGQLG